MVTCQIIEGDSLTELKKMPDESVQTCVTSPPYWGLRDYGIAGQIGQESSPAEYVDALVGVFNEVRRVIKSDGTLWLNLGDTYATGNTSAASNNHPSRRQKGTLQTEGLRPPRTLGGLKPKDLAGIPWMVAFALRDAGWFLRCDIVWAKANCMPESVTDRPTRSHEFIFLLSKSERYFYDHEAIKEPCIYDVDGTGTASRNVLGDAMPERERRNGGFKDAAKMDGKHSVEKQRGHSRRHNGFNDRWDKMSHEEQCVGMRNKRDVWTVAPANYPDAHFATFPPDLIKPCILAGCMGGGYRA